MPERPDLISRREAILRVSAVLGGTALIGQHAMLAGCTRETGDAPAPAGEGLFTDSDIAFLDEIAETILPETDTPGAKAADIGPFIALMVTDCYAPQEQRIFRDGMSTLDQACVAMHGEDFMSVTPDERLALLETLDAEQHESMYTRAPGAPPHYFRMVKELTLLGYFTSEIGCKQAQRYVESPGRYEPCADYEPGERAWAPHA